MPPCVLDKDDHYELTKEQKINNHVLYPRRVWSKQFHSRASVWYITIELNAILYFSLILLGYNGYSLKTNTQYERIYAKEHILIHILDSCIHDQTTEKRLTTFLVFTIKQQRKGWQPFIMICSRMLLLSSSQASFKFFYAKHNNYGRLKSHNFEQIVSMSYYKSICII